MAPGVWVVRIADRLADGEWHDYETVIYEVGRTVAPGVAMRRAERDREYANTTGAPRSRNLDVDRQIQAGRRGIIRDAIRYGLDKGYWITDPPGLNRARLPQGVKRRIRLVAQPSGGRPQFL